MHTSKREREIMEHALGYWYSDGKRYRKGERNAFVTGPDTEDWAPIQRLCELGLMRLRMKPDDTRGGMSVFAVTERGAREINAEPRATGGGRGR